MLHPNKLRAALDAKKETFSRAEANLLEDISRLKAALQNLPSLSLAEIDARLSAIPDPGARPTQEQACFPSVVVPFLNTWTNKEESLAWAKTVLQGITTIAADGSQIPPSKDLSIPVGVVQVGWFENKHQPGGKYVKDIACKVLGPEDLAEDEREEGGFPDWIINWKRFEMEVDCLAVYMDRHRYDAVKPLCFFDGSLVVSFAQHMLPERQRRYTNAVQRLLNLSTETRIPLVGFVDTSYANDLAVMLSHIYSYSIRRRVSDAALVNPLMKWGDRTQVYTCARDDSVLDRYYDTIDFVYLKTSSEHPPARVEFPRWVYDENQHERVLNLVRAECLIGNGYPYPCETVDAVAVLRMEDRDYFLNIFQEFAQDNHLSLRFSKKAISKRRRRG